MTLGIITTAASFFVCDRIVVGWVQSQEQVFDYAELPVFAAPDDPVDHYRALTHPQPAANALSRRFETACDRYALERTGTPLAYRSAFTKLRNSTKLILILIRWKWFSCMITPRSLNG